MEHKKKKNFMSFLVSSNLSKPPKWSILHSLIKKYIKTDQIGDFFVGKVKELFRSKFTPQIDHPVALCYARTRAITLILVQELPITDELEAEFDVTSLNFVCVQLCVRVSSSGTVNEGPRILIEIYQLTLNEVLKVKKILLNFEN